MDKDDSIFVAGHTGLIGSAIVRHLDASGFRNLILIGHSDLDLTDAGAVVHFFKIHTPQYVILAAGKVGGIIENAATPADFITANLAIQLNVIRSAHATGVKKLILFASSCMYPRTCEQPMKESALLSGQPEPTSLPYAIAKLAGMHMCLAYNKQYGEQRFIPVIPNSAFGPKDNFNPNSGHVLSSLIRRIHEAHLTRAGTLTLWGSGKPRREFIHSDDIASACTALLTQNTDSLALPLNLGAGRDFSICELAEIIAGVVGYAGAIKWDISKPDGAPRKLLDSSRMRNFGWVPGVDFLVGIKDTYKWYLENELPKGSET
jgi:GDP-L-fucose synthase